MLEKLPRLRARSRRNGTVAYFFDHGGKPRRWELFGSDRDDVSARRRYEELLAAATAPADSVDRMLADTIEALRGRVAPGTLANYRGYRKHLAAVFAGPPREITQAAVLKYLRLCPRMTFRNEISLLSMGFVHWMELGRLEFNPCFGVRIRRAASKRKRLLSALELDRIIAAADERTAVAIELAYATGLRISDLVALRWSMLEGVIDTRKTGERLAFEASDTLTAILARARALQARVASMFVLCDRRGRPWRTSTLRDRWDKAVEAAGVDDAHFHDVRAAAATEVARLHGREAAREFLGHRDPRTTLIYLRGLQVTVVRALERKTK